MKYPKEHEKEKQVLNYRIIRISVATSQLGRIVYGLSLWTLWVVVVEVVREC